MSATLITNNLLLVASLLTAPRSDDEPEAEVSPLQTPTSSTASNTSSKRVLNDFEKAFAKNKFNNAISNPAPSSTKSPSPTVTPQYTVDYADSSFAVSIELPSVSSFSSCDLSVSSTALKLTAVKSNEEEEDQTEKYGLNYTFKHQIDEDSINAKFSKVRGAQAGAKRPQMTPLTQHVAYPYN